MSSASTAGPSGRARARVLMYHGFHVGGETSRGVAGRRSYTLSPEDFESHLEAIEVALPAAPATRWGPGCERPGERLWALTFDDGLSSALAAADQVESRGWRGHFFIVSGWIGNPGFMTAAELLDLHRRGHVVGSHSVSHPDPMSGLSHRRLLEEWRRSVEDLGDHLGVPVKIASVPGGSLSRAVVAAAAEAGIDVLFTSEPISRAQRIDGCTVVGRYAIQSGHRASTVAALAAGRPLACASQWAGWNTRKVARRVLGGSYYSVRRRLLGAAARGRD